LAILCVLVGILQLQNKAEVAGVILFFKRHKFIVLTVKWLESVYIGLSSVKFLQRALKDASFLQ